MKTPGETTKKQRERKEDDLLPPNAPYPNNNTVCRQSRSQGGPVMMAGDSGVLKVTGEQLELALAEPGTPVLLVTGGILGR